MVRPKKDPNVRKNIFLLAAKQLFFSKGYADTSIQDILLAVGEKSESPSVFYYYFRSKEAIYQAVLEQYIGEYVQDIEKAFLDTTLPVQDRFVKAIAVFRRVLLESLKAVEPGTSANNRLFMLDLRDRITYRFALLWETPIKALCGTDCSEAEISRMASFICGGIGEMINRFVFEAPDKQTNFEKLCEDIIRFSARVLDIQIGDLNDYLSDEPAG